jgi:hypothetical protein
VPFFFNSSVSPKSKQEPANRDLPSREGKGAFARRADTSSEASTGSSGRSKWRV